MGSLVTLAPSGSLQIVTPPFWWLPVASHWPSGLTETPRQSSSGPILIVLSASATRTSVWLATATIRPVRSSAIPQLVPGKGKLRGGPIRASPLVGSMWIGHRKTPAEPLVSKLPDGSNMLCHAIPIGRNASSVPRARSQSTTPRSVPTARIRPSGWIDGRAKFRGVVRGMRQGSVLDGRIDLPGAQLISQPNEDPAVPGEIWTAGRPSVMLKT